MATKKSSTKKDKSLSISFTQAELVHLRDLFSVIASFDDAMTLSQSLAMVEDRQAVESSLWKKLTAACVLAKIPLGDDVQDHIIAAVSMGIFRRGKKVE
jgi:hypothetical protein